MIPLPREPPMFTYNSDGQQGLTDEMRVKQWLKDKGYVVIDSSPHEDRRLDIDIWLRSSKQEDPTRPVHVPISIKCCHDGAKFNNFGIEVDVLCREGLDSDGNPVYNWKGSSWFQNGEARYYLVLQGKDLFKVNKARLVKALENGRLVPERERTLKPETVMKQKAMGHPHIDARCLFFNRDDLLKLKIMQIIGTIDNEPKKTYGSVSVSQFKRLARGVTAS